MFESENNFNMCCSLQCTELGRLVYIRRIGPCTQMLCSVRVYVVVA